MSMQEAVRKAIAEPADPDNVAWLRGNEDAWRGRPFDPGYWGYSWGGEFEYDYARGYAAENDLDAAIQAIERYLMQTALPAERAYLYEEDGNILRHTPAGGRR
jgi:CubicO group peptidase (beta-lactamase class C family)